MGDFIDAIGRNVSGLLGGSIDALAGAFSSVVLGLQQALPGPLFPLALLGAVVVMVLLFKRLF